MPDYSDRYASVHSTEKTRVNVFVVKATPINSEIQNLLTVSNRLRPITTH